MEIDFKMRIKLRQHQKAGEQEENPERFVHQMLKAFYVDPQLVGMFKMVMFKLVILKVVMLKMVMFNWW